jgi:Xaa-Pro aminopeptidase
MATAATVRSRRFDRVRELAAEQGVDALWVSAGANFRWLAGGSPYPGGLPVWLSALIVPVGRPGVAVISQMHADILDLADTGLTDVVTYDDGDEPVAVLRRALSAAGLGVQARVGVEDSLPFADVLAIDAAAPGIRLESASAIFDRVRAVKDAEEIELLRASGRAVDAGYAAARDASYVGGSLAETGAAIYRAMIEAGSTLPALHGSFRSYRNDILQPGDIIDVDLGAEVDGYAVDTARNLFIGQPSDELAQAHELLEQAFNAAAAVVRPGALAEEVHHACVEVIGAAGHRQSWKVGHGVGLTATHEAPLLQPGNQTPLEEGMVFTIDPGYFLRRDEPLHLEETVLVTEDGCERMTGFPLGVLHV